MGINIVKTPQELKRLSDALQRRHGHPAGQHGEPAVGTRHDGTQVVSIASHASRAAARGLKARQNPVGGRPLKLSDHRARAEQAIKPMPLEDIASRARSMNISKGPIAQAARRILDGQDPGLDENSAEANTTRLLAYHLALHCLSPGTDRRARAALLAPLGPFTTKPHEMAAHLRDLMDTDLSDGEALEALAEAIIKLKGGEGRDRQAIDGQRAERLKRHVRQGNDDEALDELAEWLGVPPVDTDRDERRELLVRNNLAGFTTDNQHGQRALKGLNTSEAFKSAADPARSQKAYFELSEALSAADQTAIQAMLILTKDAGLSLQDLTKHIDWQLRAASDDLNADNPSNEANRLWATVSELGKLRIENTIVPLFERTEKRVNYAINARGAPSAAAA